VTLSADHLERAFGWIERELLGDAAVAAEFAESRAAFFAHRPGEQVSRDSLAQRRHLEWFLIERFSPNQGGAPVEVLVNAGPPSLESEVGWDESDDVVEGLEQALAALLTSLASVFEVTGIVPGEGVWVRDLAGGGEYALEEPEASHALQPADLLVGRMFDVGDHLHRISGAAGLFRGERLTRAVREDLERARSSRRGTLRLSQADLEKMFFGNPLEVTPQAADEALRTALVRARVVLNAGGLDAEDCEAVFAALRSSSDEALQQLLPGGGDTLGLVLERLAVESAVDLAAARAVLLEVWTAYAARDLARRQPTDAHEGASKRAKDARTALEAFDRGRAEGRDLEQLFGELERDLDLETEEEASDEDLAPDFPGVVAAMVEEYLWDLERSGQNELRRQHDCLRKFGEFGASVGVFENLSQRDLLLFGSIWLPELGGLQTPAEARGLLNALESFCGWCEDQHALPLRTEFEAGLGPLRESLPRLIAARSGWENGAGLDVGSVFEVRAVDGEQVVLSDARGGEVRAAVAPQIGEHLRPGDWLRAECGPHGELRVFCGYPPESARLRPA
jgi:hypothetical protein